MSYLAVFFLLIFICLILQLVLADHYSTKWIDLRYLLLHCLIYAGVIQLVSTKLQLFFTYGLLFLLMSMTVPIILRRARKVQIMGNLIWQEINFALSRLGFILLLQEMLYRLLPSAVVGGIITLCQLVFLSYILVIISYYWAVGDCFDANSLIAIFQTHLSEAKEFLQEQIPLTVRLAFVLLLGGAAAYLVRFNTSLRFVPITNWQRVVLLTLFAWNLRLCIKVDSDNYLARIFRYSLGYLRDIKEFEQKRRAKKGQSLNLVLENLDQDPNACYIVIIGESQNKSQMSVYGYSRDTTPHLRQLRQDKNYIFLDHAYACHTLTVNVLSLALTEASQYNKLNFGEAFSLLDLAKAAGYTTYWLSNHSQFGIGATPLTALAGLADHSYWLTGDTEAASTYDEALLEPLTKIPRQGKRLVFVHMMANHYEYKDRYPSTAEVFTDAENLPDRPVKNLAKVNAYDNATHYFDANLAQILAYAQTELGAKAIVFFPDHGEAVFTDKKHIPGLFTFEMARIAMFFYLSPAYQAQFPTAAANMVQHRDSYFSNDMFYDTMLGLMGIKTEHCTANQDLTSAAYNFTKNNLQTMYNTRPVSEDNESND